MEGALMFYRAAAPSSLDLTGQVAICDLHTPKFDPNCGASIRGGAGQEDLGRVGTDEEEDDGCKSHLAIISTIGC